MAGDGDHTVVTAAQLKLEALQRCAQIMEEEQVREETRLQQLQKKLEGLQREKECVLNRTRKVNADTLSILNDLRSFEELEMLDGMLNEKRVQLISQQGRQDALLELIADIEAVLDTAPVTGRDRGKDLMINELEDSSITQWLSSCEQLHCHINGLVRYCLLHTSHVVNHPFSVFLQSLRKMFRTARSREEELSIQLEYMGAREQENSSLNGMLCSIMTDCQRESECPKLGKQDMLNSLKRIGQVSQEISPMSTVMDDEMTELQRQVTAAERDVHRLQQGYETLEEEGNRARSEYEVDLKSLEERLSKAKEVVAVLRQEKSDWEALREQMSLLAS